MRADDKFSQPSTNSQDDENYGEPDYKAKGMKEYEEAVFDKIGLEYFRST